MTALRARFNYAFREYRHTRGDSIGVFLKNGETIYKRWLGFIDVEEARRMNRMGIAVPVRLSVEQYSNEALNFRWEDLRTGQFIQGCLVDEGVYGVTESSVRIVAVSD